MKTLALLLAVLTLAACAERAPAAMVRVGAPCFSLDIPADTRAEILAPRFTHLRDRAPNGDANTLIEVHVADGEAPLMLYLFGAENWRFSGHVERVVAVMTVAAPAHVEGLPDSVRFLTRANVRSENRPYAWFSADERDMHRCLSWIRHFASAPDTLPAADNRIFTLTGRHISNYQSPRNVERFEVGLPDWRIALTHVFQEPDERERPDYDRVNARLRQDAHREGDTPAFSEIDCTGENRPCEALLRLIQEGAVRFATNRDLERWESAFRNHHPIRHAWRPRMPETARHRRAYVLLRETRLPQGFTGPNAVTMFVERGVPIPRGVRSHNVYYDLDDGQVSGGFFGEPPPEALTTAAR